MTLDRCALPKGEHLITATTYNPLDFNLEDPAAKQSVAIKLDPDDCGSPSPSPSPTGSVRPSPTPSCPQPSPPAPPVICTTPSPSPTSSPSPTVPPTPPRGRCDPPPAPPATGSPISIPGGGGSGSGCSDAHTWGDPHLITFDNLSYDFHAVGEFILARSQDQTFEVQSRQKSIGSSIARNDVIALKLGSDRLTIASGSPIQIRLNGTPAFTTPEILSLPAGVIYRNNQNQLAAVWRSGEQVIIEDLTNNVFLSPIIRIPASRRGQYSGLLGDGDGDSTNDIKPRNGSVLTGSLTFEQLYKTFGNSWRISQSESLFDYGPGESTATFTNLVFPEGVFSVSSLSEADRIRAEGVCRTAGATGSLLNSCIIDVGATGDIRFAQVVPKPDKIPTSLGILTVIALVDSDYEQVELYGDNFLVPFGSKLFQITQDGKVSIFADFQDKPFRIRRIHVIGTTIYASKDTDEAIGESIYKINKDGTISIFKDGFVVVGDFASLGSDLIAMNNSSYGRGDLPLGILRLKPDGSVNLISDDPRVNSIHENSEQLYGIYYRDFLKYGIFKISTTGNFSLDLDLGSIINSYGFPSDLTFFESDYILSTYRGKNRSIIKVDANGKVGLIFTQDNLTRFGTDRISNIVVKGRELYFIYNGGNIESALVRMSL